MPNKRKGNSTDQKADNKKTEKPTSGHSPVTIIYSDKEAAKLIGNIRFCGSDIPEDPIRVELTIKDFGDGSVRVLAEGCRELDTKKRIVIYPDIVNLPEYKPRQLKERTNRKPILPGVVTYLSSLPKVRCGISTYNVWLAEAVGKYCNTKICRDIYSGVPEDALIEASIEFGIFPDEKSLISELYKDNIKVAKWHTIIQKPHLHHFEYYQNVDEEYDCHIVHSILAKKWLSRFVSRPIHVIPHGCLIWSPIDKLLARKMLGLPLDAKIAFTFGFSAESKGFIDAIETVVQLSERMPGLLMIISGAIHPVVEEHCKKILDKMRSVGNNHTMILGKYLTEDEINLYASACDVLVFNYQTPSYVSSASGALNRVLAAGKPIIGTFDSRLDGLIDGQHCIKYQQSDKVGLEEALELVLSDEEIAEKLGGNCRSLAEKISWDNTAKKHIELYGSLVGDIFTDKWYDKAYFDVGEDEPGKIFRNPDGTAGRWGFVQSSKLNWMGWIDVVNGLKITLKPNKMLDVGSGVGGFLHYANKAGIIVEGCDFSEYAVSHPFKSACGLLRLADARNLPYQDNGCDVVTTMDLFEHLYEEDIDKAIKELQRVSSKYIFCNISVSNDEGYSLKRGELPTKNLIGNMVAGHVNLRPEKYWREKLSSNGWVLRDDLVKLFRSVVPENVLTNWTCILIAEKEKI